MSCSTTRSNPDPNPNPNPDPNPNPNPNPLTPRADGDALPLALCQGRDTIICIHNANPKYDPPKLRDMWGDKTAEQAYAILEKPDVKVTNQKDKDMQLPKLKKLNEFAKSAVADVATAALPPAPPHARTCQCL